MEVLVGSLTDPHHRTHPFCLEPLELYSMMREFLFSTVYNLDAQEIPGKRFEFFDQCYLSTDERVLKSCFSNIAKLYVGACEQVAALREGVFIYSELPDGFL